MLFRQIKEYNSEITFCKTFYNIASFSQKNMILCSTFLLFIYIFISLFVCISVCSSYSKIFTSSSEIDATPFISHVIDYPASFFFDSLFLPNSCAMSCAKLGLVFAPNILANGCILLINNSFRYLQDAHAQLNITMKIPQTLWTQNKTMLDFIGDILKGLFCNSSMIMPIRAQTDIVFQLPWLDYFTFI